MAWVRISYAPGEPRGLVRGAAREFCMEPRGPAGRRPGPGPGPGMAPRGVRGAAGERRTGPGQGRGRGVGIVVGIASKKGGPGEAFSLIFYWFLKEIRVLGCSAKSIDF